MNKNMQKKLLEKIQTKNLKNVDEAIINEVLSNILKRNQKIASHLDSLHEKSAEFKHLVKSVKQELHYFYGAFQKDAAKREKLLEQLKKTKKDSEEFTQLHKKIMMTHSSTQERLELYDGLYQDLFSITGKPDSILDIGCGLNPFSIPWMKLNELHYLASEFNEKDVAFIETYFTFLRQQYDRYDLKTTKINLVKDYALLKTIKTDVVFAWKLFDILDTKTTENIMKHLNTDWLVASFSTKTLGRKKMTSPRRAGFQKMLRRLNLEYKTKEYENELFYLVRLNT